MNRRWLLLLPFGAGLLLAILGQVGLWFNPIIFLRSDLATLFIVLGLAVSLTCAGGLFFWNLAYRRYAQALTRTRREYNDAHRRFILRLDHELKNPLTAIRAGLANLGNQNDAHALSSVRAQVDRLAQLTADLRKLADLETRAIEEEPVDLAQLLDEMMVLARERPEAEHCRLRLALPQAPWPLPPVAGDRDLIFLALHNLMDNAIKFSRPNDTIEIRAFEDGPSVAVQIADTGPGVGEDELPHLGEELFRGSAARSIDGSGLGLALVYAIVARHRGNIAIRSRLGQGTVVTLRFPAVRDESARIGN
jgi:two-component system OmpR family sensor kinase